MWYMHVSVYACNSLLQLKNNNNNTDMNMDFGYLFEFVKFIFELFQWNINFSYRYILFKYYNYTISQGIIQCVINCTKIVLLGREIDVWYIYYVDYKADFDDWY